MEFGDARIARMHAHLRVEEQHHEICFFDRLLHLLADLEIHRERGILGETAGVDEPELAARPIGLREMSVAGRSRFLGNDGAFVAHDSIEQRRLPNVGATNQCNNRSVHAATSATRGSPSWTSTSMKS